MMDSESFEDMMMAGLVVQSRMWRMALGSAGAQKEAELMVAEKMTAMTQGYLNLTFGLMMGDRKCWENPMGAFTAPGRKTLRSNAKRLAGYTGR
jgi:hypothetical protein